jgi:hypothetical protein
MIFVHHISNTRKTITKFLLARLMDQARVYFSEKLKFEVESIE